MNARKWSQQLAHLLLRDEEMKNTNLTKAHFFNVKEKHWEKTISALTRYGVSKGNDTDTMDDFAKEFVMGLIEDDTLRPHLESGKEVKTSVLTAWFGQFMIRKWMILGKDASCRALMGAQSQAERKNKKLYTLSAEQTAQITYEGGDDDVRKASVDYYIPENESIEDVLHRESVASLVSETLEKRFGERAQYFQNLYKTEVEGTYKSRAEWSRAWQISYRDLNRDVEIMYETIRSLGEDGKL